MVTPRTVERLVFFGRGGCSHLRRLTMISNISFHLIFSKIRILIHPANCLSSHRAIPTQHLFQFSEFICVIVFPFARLSTKLRQNWLSAIGSPNPRVPLMRYIESHRHGTTPGAIHVNSHPLNLVLRIWGNSSYGTGTEDTFWRGGPVAKLDHGPGEPRGHRKSAQQNRRMRHLIEEI
jgi:hypothetical protein